MSYRKNQHGIVGRTASASFVVSVYSDHVIRLQISRRGQIAFPMPWWTTLCLTLQGFRWRPPETGSPSRPRAWFLKLKKSLEFRAVFKDSQGIILNEDSPGTGLGTVFTGNKVTVYKSLQESERFVGLGEELGNLDRRGTVVTLTNTDNYKYDDPRIPMYTSIPFFMGIHHHKIYGIYFDNSYRAVFNFGASNKRFSSYSFDGGDRDEFFIHDDTVRKILEHYTALTGRMSLPPQWSIGYQQSRCSYFTED